MKNAFLLVGVLICLLAYVRAQQPATWNSWMAAIGADKSFFASVGEDAKTAATDPSSSDGSSDSAPGAPVAPLPRTYPVGGMVKNGTFTGGQNWQGDGQPSPSGKGLVVTLDPSAWTRVYQVFSGDQRVQYSIEITYKLSPGITLSNNPADYTAINKRFGLDGYENYGVMTCSPGNFFGTVGDPTSASVSFEYFQPRMGTTDVQDYQHTYPPVPPNGNMVFGLAFPPGTGSVTLLTAYVDCH